MYYALINENNRINGFSECELLSNDIICLPISTTQYNDLLEKGQNYLIYSNGELILNPNYEKEQDDARRVYIDSLKCTKRVFALILQKVGITYTQLKELIATNEQAQLEWDLCIELQRDNGLLDIMALELGITSQQLDKIFLYANGEITQEELVN